MSSSPSIGSVLTTTHGPFTDLWRVTDLYTAGRQRFVRLTWNGPLGPSSADVTYNKHFWANWRAL